MIKFKDDEFLGKTVKSTRLYCAIGADPIKNKFLLRYAGGGNKFSSMCGFMFDSALEGAKFPRFMISFVCKLRSKIYRQQNTNPSLWFIFRRINKNRVDVLDKKALAVNYGFDIDKFFDSDLFKASLPKFKKYLEKGLEDARTFANKQDTETKSECGRYINAIKEAIPLMMQSTHVNDKYYLLNDLDAMARDASKGISAEMKQKALDAKMAAIRKANKHFMDKVAANLRDVDLRPHEESEKNIDEADLSKYKCKVEKIREKGEDAWKVTEVETGLWLATFYDEKSAYAFAEEYPELRAKYLDDMDKFHKTMQEAKTDKCDVKESIDKNIPKNWIAFCKDLRSKIESEVKVLVGKHFNDFKGTGTDLVNSILDLIDYLMFDEEDYNEAGNLYDSYFHTVLNNKTEAEEKQDVEEDNEEKLKEKELDNDIEESLKEIYK